MIVSASQDTVSERVDELSRISERRTRKWARANRKTGSRPETQLRSDLHRLGFRFRKNILIQLGPTSVRPDVIFTRAKVAVFVDGCFWHSCPDHGRAPNRNATYWLPKLERNTRRDRLVDAELRAAGWAVVRLWEHVAPTSAAATVVVAVASAGTGALKPRLSPG